MTNTNKLTLKFDGKVARREGAGHDNEGNAKELVRFCSGMRNQSISLSVVRLLDGPDFFYNDPVEIEVTITNLAPPD